MMNSDHAHSASVADDHHLVADHCTVSEPHHKAAKLSSVGDVCTMACKSTDDCRVELGDSICNKDGLCVRECRQDADCPAFTYCIDHSYCGR